MSPDQRSIRDNSSQLQVVCLLGGGMSWHQIGIELKGMFNSAAVRNFDYSYLDQTEFRNRYSSGENHNHIRFYIEGIKCSKCIQKLEGLAQVENGILSLRIEMGKNLAFAEIDPQILNFSELAEKISELGFKPIPLAPDMNDEVFSRMEDRRDLVRLAVAGACAGNIMTFSFANYLGAAGTFSTYFSWLSFALYLPVVTYVALPFYRGAWQSVKHRQLSIDLPMAVASFSGFLFSTWQLILGREDIYFDSLSGFLFLILLARWTQRRLQRQFLRPQELTESLNLERVRRLNETGWVWTPVDHIESGDRILVQAPETLPAESELVSSSAHFSLAWLSGESRPKTFFKNALIPAGARLLNGEAHLKVVKPLRDTSFGQILEQVQKFSLATNRMVSMADRWAQWLIAIVFLTALIFLALYWNISSEDAVQRSLALIVLACPCAMAFGTPLGLASALRQAQRKGLIVRNANVFEKVTQVKTIFFDKTGTLTDSDLVLNDRAEQIPQVYQKIILSLENESMHPIAFALRKSFGWVENLPPVDGLKEVPGVGVSGYIYGKFYELKQNSSSLSETGCALFEDHQPILNFSFSSQLKPKCLETLTHLRKMGYETVLLSGDKKTVGEPLGRQLGFAPNEIFCEVDPCQKSLIVSRTPFSMMVGDGINDSLALMRADVGVAVSGGMESALKSSDVYLTETSLDGLVELFKISRGSIGLIRQNLMISVIYNIVGGALALLGFINPFVAAVLMPISSGFILLSTWLRGRLH